MSKNERARFTAATVKRAEAAALGGAAASFDGEFYHADARASSGRFSPARRGECH